jgi:hypothetical protein
MGLILLHERKERTTMITDPTSERVLGAARALFQEQKTLSASDLRDYLKNAAQLLLSETEIEKILAQALTGQGSNLPPVALHQAFLFKRAARGFWHGYSILTLECTYTLPAPTEADGTGRSIYLTFGIADDEDGVAKFLGASPTPDAVLKQLQSYGLDIKDWFPLGYAQWRALLSHTKDLEDLIDTFGQSLFSNSGTPRCSFVRAC